MSFVAFFVSDHQSLEFNEGFENYGIELKETCRGGLKIETIWNVKHLQEFYYIFLMKI